MTYQHSYMVHPVKRIGATVGISGIVVRKLLRGEEAIYPDKLMMLLRLD